MDPITLMALAGGLQGAGRMAGDIINASSIFDKSDKSRLKELERLQQLAALGYKVPEMEMMQRQLLNPLQAESTSRMASQQQMLAGANAGAGAAAALAGMEDNNMKAASARAGEAVMQANVQQQNRNREELQGLQKLKEQEKAAMLDAILGGGLETAGEAAATVGTAADDWREQTAFADIGANDKAVEEYNSWRASLYGKR